MSKMSMGDLPDATWWLSIPILGTIFAWMHKLRSDSKGEIKDLRENLDRHRLDVANNRATNHYVAEVENRLNTALSDVKATMTRMEQKLDRVIEGKNGK